LHPLVEKHLESPLPTARKNVSVSFTRGVDSLIALRAFVSAVTRYTQFSTRDTPDPLTTPNNSNFQ